MIDDPINLSEEGRRRQREILDAALGAATARKRRASVIRGAECGLLVALIPVLVWQVTRSQDLRPLISDHFPPRIQRPEPLVIVQHIETDPNIVQRLSLPPIKSTIRHIGDAELMRELADAHQPAGLITVNGKSQLIFR